MKKLFSGIILSILMAFAVNSSYAQDWTKEQLEVWNAVESIWEAWSTGDADMLASLLHPKYQSWSNTMPLPSTKESIVNYLRFGKEYYNMLGYYNQPARITVLENAAVVNYYYQAFEAVDIGDGKQSKKRTGKCVDFFVKEGNKWLLLGDMEINDEENED